MKLVHLILLIALLSSLILAQPEPEDIPLNFDGDNLVLINENENLSIFNPLIETIHPLFRELSILVGGLFGLYVILILIRIHYERRKVKLLKDIRYDFEKLNQHFKLLTSREKKGFIRKLFSKLKRNQPSKPQKK